ncbi:MAG: nickel pincer cofactor biosynthesis protein LarB [archaeon]|uniref:PurE domain-containing protein n=1 Tax=Methanobrevibacter gottschalkii DSM 11977 TaxID=1122229 RepID=A0A3N5BZZ3_9EURY|nr:MULTISPECIES: nickel pincer cofactor biosynthesis protein LarB [Methanobrevibacter]MCQ2971143.1 nickel pincer cofactor biosynthesis protein LarB [archaeon]OEC93964.1 hypothetical protein A9505_01305 [Methanobrevibacter sp. A27]RPF52702.1 hypothetical protein EDC42_0251 [Methanobrevibacter gottschalkii DSM 11977]
MKDILERLVDGEINIDEAERLINADNILEFNEVAKFDSKRKNRAGFPEAVFAQSKEYEDLLLIIKKYMQSNNDNLIVTRLSKERYENILNDLGENSFVFEYNRRAQILIIRKEIVEKPAIAKVGIMTAGTSDVNIAEEARVIVEEGGCEAITSYDVGVAGIHRLFPQIARMVEENVRAIIVCAGMEGTLPSVVAGLVDVPVIAVPTSVGYGVGEGGRVALDAMLQSCAPGIAVVNIDNGFGAGVFALTIVNSD